MKQYCRYCANCIYGDAVYCAEKQKTMSEETAKRVNQCKHFIFNEIDVFNFDHKYTPAKPKKENEMQMNLFEFIWWGIVMARKKIDNWEKRTEDIRFKVSPSELEQLTALAQKKGHSSVHSYARELALTKPKEGLSKDDINTLILAFNDLKETVESIETEYKDEQDYIPIALEETNRKLDKLILTIASLT